MHARHWIALLMLIAATGAVAQELHDRVGHKSASEWTDEERIASRTTPELMAARVRMARAANGSLSTRSIATLPGRSATDVIDGARNPELFLSSEVFERLMTLAFALGDDWRGVWSRQVREAGLPREFWEQLSAGAQPYIAELQWRQQALERGRNASPEARAAVQRQVVALDAAICRDGHAALLFARSHFGPAFDRFLYTAVAPGMSRYVFDEMPRADRLATRAGGCQ